MTIITNHGFSADLEQLSPTPATREAELFSPSKGLDTDGQNGSEPLWPRDLVGATRFVTNLSSKDGFINMLSFITSIRQAGVLLVVETEQYHCFGIESGCIRWLVATDSTILLPAVNEAEPQLDSTAQWDQLKGSTKNKAQESLESLARNALARYVRPITGVAFWAEQGAITPSQALDLPLEYLLLNTVRLDDEHIHQTNRLRKSIPIDTRLTFNLTSELNQPVFKALQTVFGAPPFRFTGSQLDALSVAHQKLLHDAIANGDLVIQRDEQRTAPPQSASPYWSPDQQSLQLLIARYNHVLRRLALLSGWTPLELTNQLSIFSKFYGYGRLFEGVHHLGDGAITPSTLIQNAHSASNENTHASDLLANALQDLIFFNLSSARSLAAADRRALMSITSDIVTTTQT